MYAEFRQTAKEIFDAAEREGRLIRNPDNGRCGPWPWKSRA